MPLLPDRSRDPSASRNGDKSQFLTRKLWDAGNSAPYGHRGDLTTLSEAIHYHAGEARAVRDAFLAQSADDQAAVIEFLKTLQILPDGSPPVVVEHPDRDDHDHGDR